MSKAKAREVRRSWEWAHIQSMKATLLHIYTMRRSGRWPLVLWGEEWKTAWVLILFCIDKIFKWTTVKALALPAGRNLTLGIQGHINSLVMHSWSRTDKRRHAKKKSRIPSRKLMPWSRVCFDVCFDGLSRSLTRIFFIRDRRLWKKCNGYVPR